VSSGTGPSKKQPLDPADADAIRDAGAKIFALCTPWPEWTVARGFLIGSSAKVDPSTIKASDHDGEEILSYIPPSSVRAFLSRTGQSVVSDCILSILLVSKMIIDDPEVDGPPRHSYQQHPTMRTANLRSSIPAGVVSVEIQG
jgi:hypothetical protein